MNQETKVKIGLALVDRMMSYENDIGELCYSQDEDFNEDEWIPMWEILDTLYREMVKEAPDVCRYADWLNGGNVPPVLR